MPHAEHVEISDEMAKLEALSRRRLGVLAYPVHGSASEVNRSGADAQVVPFRRYLIVFHPFVEQLVVFHTFGLVLTSSEPSTSISMAMAS